MLLSRELCFDGCTVRVEAPRAGLMMTVVQGRVNTDAVDGLLAGFDDIVALSDGPVTVFQDWSEVTGYTPTARPHYVAETARRIAQLGPITFLTSSSLVTMGLSVANIVLKHELVALTDRERYESLRRAACVGGPGVDDADAADADAGGVVHPDATAPAPSTTSGAT